jgi:hypothetical protein
MAKSSIHQAGRVLKTIAIGSRQSGLVGEGDFSLTSPFYLYKRTNGSGSASGWLGYPNVTATSLPASAFGTLGLRRMVAKRPIDKVAAKDAMWLACEPR